MSAFSNHWKEGTEISKAIHMTSHQLYSEYSTIKYVPSFLQDRLNENKIMRHFHFFSYVCSVAHWLLLRFSTERQMYRITNKAADHIFKPFDKSRLDDAYEFRGNSVMVVENGCEIWRSTMYNEKENTRTLLITIINGKDFFSYPYIFNINDATIVGPNYDFWPKEHYDRVHEVLHETDSSLYNLFKYEQESKNVIIFKKSKLRKEIERMHSPNKKKAREELIDCMPFESIHIIGPKVVQLDAPESQIEREGGWHIGCCFDVSEHIRMQWIGSEKDGSRHQEPRLIKSFEKGAGLPKRQKTFLVRDIDDVLQI